MRERKKKMKGIFERCQKRKKNESWKIELQEKIKGIQSITLLNGD